MKVLVGSLSRHFGGVESLFLNIVRYKNASDYQMDFVCTDAKAAREEDFRQCGSDVIHISRPSKDINGYRQRFANLFDENGYDIYHVNLTRFRFPLDVMLAKSKGAKVILHCHSTQIYSTNKTTTKIIRNIQQVLFRPIMLGCSSLNLACSENAGEYLFGNKPYSVLYNGIDTERFLFNPSLRKEMRRQLGIENRKVIGHVGRFSPEKNHRFLISLIEELAKTDPSYLLLCLGNGDLFEKIKDDVQKRGLENHVLLLGERADIPQLLNAMDIFAFPSLHEALPVTLIEAQANGLPCVISDYVTKEIDVYSMTRLPVSDGVEKWAETINNISCCRINVGEYAERLADFDIKRMAANLQEIYKGIK